MHTQPANSRSATTACSSPAVFIVPTTAKWRWSGGEVALVGGEMALVGAAKCRWSGGKMALVGAAECRWSGGEMALVRRRSGVGQAAKWRWSAVKWRWSAVFIAPICPSYAEDAMSEEKKETRKLSTDTRNGHENTTVKHRTRAVELLRVCGFSHAPPTSAPRESAKRK